MPSAPLLKVRSTGRGATRGRNPEELHPARRRGSLPGATAGPYGGSRTWSSQTMPKKNKQNGTVSNGTTHRKDANGATNKKGGKRDNSKPQLSLQIAAGVLVVIVAVVFLQTDFRKLLGSRDNPGGNSVDNSHSNQKQTNEKSSSDSEKTTAKKWRKASPDALQRFGSKICNINRVNSESLTSDIFEKEYRYKKPLIVKFPKGAKDWTNPKKWSLQSLKREYGLWSVLSGNSREIVRRGGNGEVQTSFTEYVDRLMDGRDEGGEPFYIFDRAFYNDSSLPKTLKPPKYFEIKDGIDDSIFFLGASGSGVTFHKHADAWNGVIYGQKRWFLYPSSHTPPGGVHPGFTQIEWYDTVYPNLKGDDMPMECIQQAGEILYLPEGTYHGTINLGDTVAIGIQKKEASIETEKLFYDELQVERMFKRDQRDLMMKKKVEIFERLLDLLPESTEVMMKAGQMYTDSGRREEGLRLTQAAIDRDPYFIIAKLNKAKTLMQMAQNNEAEEILKDLLKINPKLWDIHATYGDFLMGQSRPAEAATMFRGGTKLKPDMIPFWIHLGYALKASGDNKGAEQVEKKVREMEEARNKASGMS